MNKQRIAIVTSIGSALEYYDFVIYVLLAHYLTQVFFPAHNVIISLLNTLGVFAVGYIARPIGGVIFGNVGDKLGRKTTFMISILLMASATFGIGLLPGYATLGYLSPLLLIFLRILQGLAQGAELPGAVTFVCEHALPRERARLCGTMFMGVGLGAVLATFINFSLTSLLSAHAMQSFGWRIPFILGGFLALVGFIVRQSIDETPAFLAMNHLNDHKIPAVVLLQENWLNILIGIGITLFGACFIIFSLFLPTYLSTFYHYQAKHVYAALSIALLLGAPLIPIFGMLADKLGRRNCLLGASLLMLLSCSSFFALASLQTYWALYLFVVTYQVIVSFFAACYAPLLAELFPTNVRYTGVAISYNIAFTLAAFLPLFVSWLLAHWHEQHVVAVLFMVLAGITFVSSIISKRFLTQIN